MPWAAPVTMIVLPSSIPRRLLAHAAARHHGAAILADRGRTRPSPSACSTSARRGPQPDGSRSPTRSGPHEYAARLPASARSGGDVDALRYFVGRKELLEEILHAAPGSCYAVTGPQGSGKSWVLEKLKDDNGDD